VSGLQLLAVSPADPLLLYARAVRGPEELLLRSTDGGQSFGVQLALGEIIEGLELSPDGRTVWLGSYSLLHRSTDGGLTFAQLPEPIVNACARYDGRRLLACGSEPDHGWSMGASTDGGERWTPLFTLGQLQQVAPHCPASSATAQVCSPLLPGLLNALQPGSSPAPPPAVPTPAGEGGCTSGAGEVGGLAGLALLGVLGRRKVRSRPHPG
jgi:hypothetical protein